MLKLLKKICIHPFLVSNLSHSFTSLKDSLFTISLVGRPNVGKSSLFNKLSGGYNAITDSMPGLTRDRKEIVSNFFEVPVRLVDTAGWEGENEEAEIQRKMMDQTRQALIYADLALFIVDVREGITSTDIFLAQWLRKKTLIKKGGTTEIIDPNKKNAEINKIILVANKAEYDFDNDIYDDIYKLGFGDPIFVSAEQGDGMHDLIKVIEKEIPKNKITEYEDLRAKRVERQNSYKNKLKQEILDLKSNSNTENNDDFSVEEWEKEFDLLNPNPEDNSDLDYEEVVENVLTTSVGSTHPGIASQNYLKNRTIQISIVGKPNVGKSSLVNSLIKENRVIVDDLSGTTRDSISVNWIYKEKKITLIDTAGIEKSIKKKSDVERKVHKDTMKAIQFSHVVVCVIDALNAFRVQDLSVAQYVLNQGRALILAVNKWDLVPKEHRPKALKYMQKQVERSLGDIRKIPLNILSAKTGFKVDDIMDQVLQLYEKWNIRISTGILNNWLSNFKKIQNLPNEDGDKLKIRFMSQIKSRPPTFVVFVNDRNLFKDNYFKFMKGKLTEEFNLEGIPIRILIRDTLYKKYKKEFEKDAPSKSRKLKNYFLKKRRIARFAKEKLAGISNNKTQ